MRVADLGDNETGLDRRAALDSRGSGTPRGILVASRLRSNGAVAWISCRLNPRFLDSFGRCNQRGGVAKHVWVWNLHASKPRLADSGRSIRPGTLRLRGSRLSWRHGRALRHARLR